jgi:hypothetical protein
MTRITKSKQIPNADAVIVEMGIFVPRGVHALLKAFSVKLDPAHD